jgi:hypothetical protein
MADVNITERFEREKLCYEQNYEQFRSLNQIMWQVPIIAMTLTGGLWFGATKVLEMRAAQYALLFLACVGNAGLVVVLKRTRFVMGEYLNKIKEFHPDGYVDASRGGFLEGNKVVMRTFATLLALSAIMSLIGILLLACSARLPLSEGIEWVNLH